MEKLKTLSIHFFSKIKNYQKNKWVKNPIGTQAKVLRKLLKNSKNTIFAKDHNLEKVKTYKDLKKAVPIRDYEKFRPYVDRIAKGEKNILTKGRPSYLLKTSGTTSGKKYIPLSKEGLCNQLNGAKSALLNYIYINKKTNFIKGKSVFLQGSPNLQIINNLKIGRLSGIVAHHIPFYLKNQYFPSWKVNCLKDWEEKIEAIVEETYKEKITIISGIPPWVKMYFEKLVEKTNQKIGEIFPNLSLMITGGVNYEVYRHAMDELIGRKIDIIETYPASEGFIAYQDSQEEKGLLLLLDQGIFYEFIAKGDYDKKNPKRISLEKVEIGVDYVLILNTDSGFWGYEIGDVIRFVSKNPYKILFIGRINQFTSAFGEHVIGYEVETALKEISEKHNCNIVDFTIAPQVNPKLGLPYHEWFIEFETLPFDLEKFGLDIDKSLRNKNPYYDDLIVGNILRPLIIRKLKKGSINKYMKSIGKLGGQFKMVHLSNDRKIADQLNIYEEK